MIKLFSEEVDATLTNSDHNILQVKSFEETFFDVYEFELNGQKYIGESIGKYETDPIIKVPVVENGKEYEVPFVLREGAQMVTYNSSNNKTIVERVHVAKEPETVIEETRDKLSMVVEDKLTEINKLPSEKEHNVLQVESLHEAFFDVYEFKLNGQQFIKECIGKYGEDPIISIPIVKGNEECEMPFVLRQVKQVDSLNNKNTIVVERILEQPTVKEINCDIVERVQEAPVSISKEDLLETFQKEKEAAIKTLRVQNAATMEEVQRIRDSILIESQSEAFEARTKEEEKLTKFVESKLKEITKTNQILASRIEKDIDLSLEANYGDFVKRLKEARKDLKTRELENKKLLSEINALEKAHIELNDSVNKREANIVESHDKLDRSVNKALSRLGQTNKELSNSREQFENVQSDLQDRINKAEERVKQYYNDHIKTVEDSVFTNIRKKEIIDVVKNSKAQIIAELDNARGLKQQVTSFIKEATEDYDPVKGNKNFLKSLERRISKKFEEEMVRVKRMIEFGGGGGSGNELNKGGTIRGTLNVEGNILSGGTNLDLLFARSGTTGGSGTIAGSGTASNVTLWDGISSITDSKLVQTSAGMILSGGLNTEYIELSTETGTFNLSANNDQGFVIGGASTIQGNLSVLGEFTYIDTIVSITSALSVVNHGTGPAFYAEQTGANQPIAKFVDTEGGEIVFDDGGKVGIGTASPAEKLTVTGNISASGNISGQQIKSTTLSATGRVDASNISTIENKVEGLYSYLINNFDTNQITTATSLTDFVDNFSKAGLTPGDVITLSAINTAYILGDNDGSTNTDWLEVNLKPNFLFYRSNKSNYAILDSVPLSASNSSKYIIQVEDETDNAIFYGEVNVVSNGTIAVATEYALNHTTVFPFVEFGAEVINNRVSLSAMALEGKNMSNFTFKGNRSNLFG
jgi:hypothetical protein